MTDDELRQLSATVQCQQATARFYAALDASDFDSVAAAMLPEGVWYRQGNALKGPTAVRAALANRPQGRTTAHLVQNLVVDLEADNTATVRYMTLVYRCDAPLPVSLPVPLGSPLSIAFNEDRLQRDGSGQWCVLQKRSERKFES
jgi:ketosteroid isomerase-like protein